MAGDRATGFPAGSRGALRDDPLLLEIRQFQEVRDLFHLPPGAVDFLVRLKARGADAVDLLIRILEQGQGGERAFAATLLGFFDTPAAAVVLLRLTRTDADYATRAEASRSLALSRAPGVVEHLVSLVSEEGRDISFLNAVYGLCLHGSELGVKAAREFIADPSRPLTARLALARNLLMLHRDDLMDLVGEIAAVFAGSVALMHQVVAYYRAIGNRPALAALAAIEADPRLSNEIRDSARKLGASVN